MRGNRNIFSGKSIYNREIISRQNIVLVNACNIK